MMRGSQRDPTVDTKLKRSFHRQFRRTVKHNDAKHMQWRVVMQREVDKLYRSMVEMQQSKLVSRDGETPEEAIFGVLCLLGDCVLADKWLSQWSKHIKFDFQLQNYCERIEEWLVDLSQKGHPVDMIGIQPATCQALGSCLLARVFAERLENCTVLHLAAISGDHNMVVAVSTIWEEFIRDMIISTRGQLAHRADDDRLRQRVEQLEGDWRCHNSFGETPYDLVPECAVVGHKKSCFCSASFNDVPCTARNARRSLLANTEAPAPVFFSGFFAIIVVSIIVTVVSIHSQTNEHRPEQFSAAEWGGIVFSFMLLWTVLALSSFIRHLWNVLTLGLVMLELAKAPSSCQTPPLAPLVGKIKKRRLAVRIEKVLAVVLGTDSPSDADLNQLERALNESRQYVGPSQKLEYILDEELIKRAHDLLLSRRETRRRAKEFSHMRKLAGKLLANLADLEVEFRTRVDTQLSIQLQNSSHVELMRAEQFIQDPRLKDEEDVLRVAFKAGRVKELMNLREKLEQVMINPHRDDVFEHVVMRCREARIQESRLVKERLQAIEKPRSVMTQLETTIMAERIDTVELERALIAASSCPPRADLTTLVSTARGLNNGLKILEQAQTNGRKAHAQLLVSSDHDISHIEKLQQELTVFKQACQKLRGEAELPKNIQEVNELLEKWKREQGPSRKLKTAVSGTDCEVLKVAIAEAKEAGIGIKAARKRLSALEQKEKIVEQLAVAMKKKDINHLREAVATARKAGVNVDEEREVLKSMVQQEACREKLALACQSNREDKLKAAVASARELDVDCTAAQHQLEKLMETRLAETLLKEEARATQRVQCMADLDRLLVEPNCEMSKLVDAMRLAKVVKVDIANALKVLKERVTRELHDAMNPIDNNNNNDNKNNNDNNDDDDTTTNNTYTTNNNNNNNNNNAKALADAIRSASLVNGFGSTVDTTSAKARLEKWQKQERCSKQLTSAIDTVEKSLDSRTMSALSEMLATSKVVLGGDSELVQQGVVTYARASATMELMALQRSCRLAHEQACMLHPRAETELNEGEGAEYIKLFVDAVNSSKSNVEESILEDMLQVSQTWVAEAKLIYNLRVCMAARDHPTLAKAIEDTQQQSKNVNVEPSKRVLDKLNRQAEHETLRLQIEEAQKSRDCGRLSVVIEAAKSAGLATYDATVTLVKWTNEGRNILSRARTSRSKERLREALETTAAMGLGDLSEWADAKRTLEGGFSTETSSGTSREKVSKPVKPSSSSVVSSSSKDSILDSSDMGPRHPRWKTEICSHWMVHGTCSYGKDRCNFAHGDDDLRKVADGRSTSESSSKSDSPTKKEVSKPLIRAPKPPDASQVWNNHPSAYSTTKPAKANTNNNNNNNNTNPHSPVRTQSPERSLSNKSSVETSVLGDAVHRGQRLKHPSASSNTSSIIGGVPMGTTINGNTHGILSSHQNNSTVSNIGGKHSSMLTSTSTSNNNINNNNKNNNNNNNNNNSSSNINNNNYNNNNNNSNNNNNILSNHTDGNSISAANNDVSNNNTTNNNSTNNNNNTTVSDNNNSANNSNSSNNNNTIVNNGGGWLDGLFSRDDWDNNAGTNNPTNNNAITTLSTLNNNNNNNNHNHNHNHIGRGERDRKHMTPSESGSEDSSWANMGGRDTTASSWDASWDVYKQQPSSQQPQSSRTLPSPLPFGGGGDPGGGGGALERSFPQQQQQQQHQQQHQQQQQHHQQQQQQPGLLNQQQQQHHHHQQSQYLPFPNNNPNATKASPEHLQQHHHHHHHHHHRFQQHLQEQQRLDELQFQHHQQRLFQQQITAPPQQEQLTEAQLFQQRYLQERQPHIANLQQQQQQHNYRLRPDSVPFSPSGLPTSTEMNPTQMGSQWSGQNIQTGWGGDELGANANLQTAFPPPAFGNIYGTSPFVDGGDVADDVTSQEGDQYFDATLALAEPPPLTESSNNNNGNNNNNNNNNSSNSNNNNGNNNNGGNNSNSNNSSSTNNSNGLDLGQGLGINSNSVGGVNSNANVSGVAVSVGGVGVDVEHQANEFLGAVLGSFMEDEDFDSTGLEFLDD